MALIMEGEVFKRTDGRWAWRIRSANNGQIIATDGSQGFENREDAAQMMLEILGDGERITIDTRVDGSTAGEASST